MNTKPAAPIAITTTKPTSKMSVETARRLLTQALEEKKTEQADESKEAYKRAINAYSGASVLLPSETDAPAGTAVPEQKSGG